MSILARVRGFFSWLLSIFARPRRGSRADDHTGRAGRLTLRPIELSPGSHKCVLCVAENRDLIRNVYATLRTLGFEVEAAHTLVDAQVLIETRWHRFVLLEEGVPDNDRLMAYCTFAECYQRRTMVSNLLPGSKASIVWFERIGSSGREFSGGSGPALSPVPERLPPRRPRPLLAHAEVALPEEEPVLVDAHGRPLPPEDVI